MAQIIHTNGVTEELKDLSLASLQDAVKGYIEPVMVNGNQLMFCNEEGLIHGLEVNLKATALAGKFLVGDVVLFTYEETKHSQEELEEEVINDNS